MPRSRPLPPNTRLDWRDPKMPLVREYRFLNGKAMTEVPPEYEQRYRAHQLQATSNPRYLDDPTYNLRRRKP